MLILNVDEYESFLRKRFSTEERHRGEARRRCPAPPSYPVYAIAWERGYETHYYWLTPEAFNPATPQNVKARQELTGPDFGVTLLEFYSR